MIVEELGGPSALKREDAPDPEPGLGEVLVDVKAIGCNFFDTLITRGKYQVQPELPFAPGAEAAGIVEAVGDDVSHVAPGARVTVLLSYGAFASKIVAPAERIFPIAEGMAFEAAAALGVVYQTSYVALVPRARLQPGETLLVHAAAGGVGLAAVQIGVALGARVIGTGGTPEKLDLIRQNGADVALNYREEDFVERTKELTDGRGADVIYDPVGGDTFDRSLKCIAFDGRLLVIGFASGRIPEAKLNRVLLKNISLVGLHWGLYFDRDPETLQEAQRALVAMYGEGKIDPLVSATYPLTEAAKALDALGSRKTTGKVVLVP